MQMFILQILFEFHEYSQQTTDTTESTVDLQLLPSGADLRELQAQAKADGSAILRGECFDKFVRLILVFGQKSNGFVSVGIRQSDREHVRSKV